MLQVGLQKSMKILSEQRNLWLGLVKNILSQRTRQDSLLTYKVRDGEIHCNRLLLSSPLSSSPCIGRARPKFELTNQDSAGGKTLLSWRQCKLNTISDCEQWKIWIGTFCISSKLLMWRRKWDAGVWHGNSLVGILKLTISRGESNFSIAFIFVSCEQKGYYRLGLLSFLTAACILRAQPLYARCSFGTPCWEKVEESFL